MTPRRDDLAFHSVADFALGPTERACLIGKTGSGKTTLAEQLCACHADVVVLDTKTTIRKDALSGKKWAGYECHRELRALFQSDAHYLVWTPTTFRDSVFAEECYRFLSWVYARKHCLLYLDEATSIVSGNDMPDPLVDIIARGRELEIACLIGTQRPKFIPNLLFTESEWHYVFQLKHADDRFKVEEMSGIDGDLLSTRALPPRYFYVTGDRLEYPAGPLKISLDSGSEVVS